MPRLFSHRLLPGAFRIWGIAITLVMLAVPLLGGAVSAAAPGTERFQRTWARTDQPVAELLVSRTWMWGPEAFTDLLTEPYAEAPGGERTVQYFDKSRMEDNTFRTTEEPWDVTNGLLVVELITGKLQIGDNEFEEREPAEVNVAGDLDDPDGPQYATFAALLDEPPAAIDSLYSTRLDRAGNLTDDPSLASQDVRAAHIDAVTNHAIAGPFWGFMNSTGLVYEDSDYGEAALFQDPNFATGRPISEAYWAEVLVGGTPRDVLIQCFERRCLTYTPDNPEGWQVEAGNVGLHYYEWRYGDVEDLEPTPPGNQPPGQQPPADPPPGNDPPQDPPPGQDPPQDPPDNPPQDGDVPEAPYIVHAAGYGGVANGPHVRISFDIGPGSILAAQGALQPTGADMPAGEHEAFHVYRGENGRFALKQELGKDERLFDDYDVVRGGEYCYYVTAVNQYGESDPSDTACVEVPYPPDAPQLVSPAPGYVSNDREVEFAWNTVPGIDRYVVCVVKPEFGNVPCDLNAVDPANGLILWTTGQTGPVGAATIELPDTLTPDGEVTDLVWSVAGCIQSADDCGYTPQYRDLQVDLSGLHAPALLSPADGYTTSDRQITLAWEPVEGAVNYRVCYASEPGDYCPPDGHQTSLSGYIEDTSYTLYAPSGELFEAEWTVGACDAQGDCVWQADTRSLTADRRFGPPELVGAEPHFDNNPRHFVFEWNLSPGADAYVVCVAEPGANCESETGNFVKSPVLGPAATTRALLIPETLAPDGQDTLLHWTVGACDQQQNCLWQYNVKAITVALS